MNDGDDIDCVDLSDVIDESAKKEKNEEQLLQTKSLMKTISSKVGTKELEYSKIAKKEEENILGDESIKLFNTMKSDIAKFIEDNAEANSILKNNFTVKKYDQTDYEDGKKVSLLESLKKALNDPKDGGSLLSTLKIDNEVKKKAAAKNNIMESESVITNDAEEGLSIGSYVFDGSVKIAKLLGEGAQAQVYSGVVENEDNETELIMAIKHFVIDASKQAEDNEIDNLVNKCQNMKELSHDNIIQYFDCESEYKEDDKKYIVNIAMEFQETNLSDYMKNYLIKNKTDRLPMKLIAKITKNILDGLEYLHTNKIIHRDLKPENILMSLDGESVKIGDFGISTWVNENQNKYAQTKVFMKRSVAGTGIYMAPEVLQSKPYGYECDIWSLGCIVLEMAGGIKPYCTKEVGKEIPSSELHLLRYGSPLEIADENVKDIIYAKNNRTLLDFLQKCWRGNNVYRPNASELLKHPFITKQK